MSNESTLQFMSSWGTSMDTLSVDFRHTLETLEMTEGAKEKLQGIEQELSELLGIFYSNFVRMATQEGYSLLEMTQEQSVENIAREREEFLKHLFGHEE